MKLRLYIVALVFFLLSACGEDSFVKYVDVDIPEEELQFGTLGKSG